MARRSAEAPKPSPALAPAQIAKAWSAGKMPRAVMVVGPESALREEALAGIRKAAFGEGDGGMSWVLLRGPVSDQDPDRLEPAKVLEEVFTRSMFASSEEPKVVVVRQADLLVTKAEPREIFERNLEKIPDLAVLVFEVAQPGNLKNTNFFKKIAAAGGVVACEALRSQYGLDGPDSPLVAELERRGRGLSLSLSAGAAAALIERSGQSLGVLEEELAKLSLALGSGEGKSVAVSEADIEKICASSRLVGAFEFADAVAERDAKRALEALGAIFAHGLGDHQRPGRVVTSEGSIAMRLLGALNYKLAQLQDLRALLDSGMNEFQAFGELKLFGFRQEAARRALRKHTSASLRKAMEAMLRANLDLRTSAGRQAALEKMVWDICR